MHIFHTIREGFRELNTSNAQLRKFGFFVGCVLLLIYGAVMFFLDKTLHLTTPVTGIALILLGLIFPRLLLWPYYVWMGLALVLGSIVSPVFLAILFFVFLTPIGVLKRFFHRPQKRGANTYWLPHDGSQDPKRMEDLF